MLSTRHTPRSRDRTLGYAFIILIILQSYLVPLIAIAAGSDYNRYVDYSYIYVISSYALIVFSIVYFHDKGLDVFQDHFSLWTIILTCFFRVSLGGANEIYYKGALIFLGIVLLNYTITHRNDIRVPTLKSILIGLVWSVGTVVVISLLQALLSPASNTAPSNLLTYVMQKTAFQLSFVTVIEESCFRGLLVGFLVMNGHKENTALLIQAIFFWGIHYMRIADPVFFFLIIPLFTLSATILIKKSRAIFLSIMMHTFSNVLESILVALL